MLYLTAIVVLCLLIMLGLVSSLSQTVATPGPVVVTTDDRIKYKICDDKNLRIDSVVKTLILKNNTFSVYMFIDNYFVELSVRITKNISQQHAHIETVADLSAWSPQIKAPIDMVIYTENIKNVIQLVNCKQNESYEIMYDHNRYVSTERYDYCNDMFEHLLVRDRPNHQILTDVKLKHTINDTNLIITKSSIDFYLRTKLPSGGDPTQGTQWLAMVSKSNDANSLEKILNETKPFYSLNGHNITAAFANESEWYLFGGRFYCRVMLVEHYRSGDFQPCRPQDINQWIPECSDRVASVEQEKQEISVLVIVLVVIITMAVLIIVIMVLLIYKEIRKSKTNTGRAYSYDH